MRSFKTRFENKTFKDLENSSPSLLKFDPIPQNEPNDEVQDTSEKPVP